MKGNLTVNRCLVTLEIRYFMPHLQTVRKPERSVMFSDLGNPTFQAILILQTVSSCMSYSDVAWENWALAVTSTDSTSAAIIYI